MAMNDLLRIWLADMIDRGLAVTSRKRYVEKLSSLYKEYALHENLTGNPFDGLNELCTLNAPVTAKPLQAELTDIEKAFDAIMADAASKPELAILLFLLFNASSDIEKAISLTTDKYSPEFRQLDEIINPSEFHHRRKYVFDLGQSRKRMPQLVREVIRDIDNYLRAKDIKFVGGFTHKTVTALWIAKARRCGVRLTDLKQVVGAIPPEYEYLRFVNSSTLSDEEISSIKQQVAESFSPSGKRWYAIKLRRGFIFDNLKTLTKSNLAEYYSNDLFFYPQKEIARRIEKRIEIDTVPVISDVVFMHINPRLVRKVDALIKSEKSGYVFKVTSAADSDYSIIDKRSMAGFQHMIGIFTPDIKVELTTESPVGIGREVIITGGVMSGYEGLIFNIKDDSDMRQIYIRLSDKYSIKAEVKVEEIFVKAIG